MIKIAVCDDSNEDLSITINILNEYKALGICDIEYESFTSGVELVSSIQAGNTFQIILLDIIMPRVNGIDIAKEINDYDKEVRIIFMTCSQEFAVESYAVGAYYYILKPIKKGQLFQLLNKVRKELEICNEKSIIVKCKSTIVRIVLTQLEFVEVINRTIFYHLNDGTVLQSTGVFSNIEPALLSYRQFVKPHRSYIVNLNYIDFLMPKELLMRSNITIPIAKSCYKSLKDTYFNYLLNENVE